MTSDATPALQWGHINVNVSDLDRSIAFYETSASRCIGRRSRI